VEIHRGAALDHGAHHALLGLELPLDDVEAFGAELLDLQRPPRVVEPEQDAGVEVERLLEQVEREVEPLVDRLDGGIAELELLLLARALAALQAEVYCLSRNVTA
jgi:hypothetical protein